jgi:hypothetical protein
MKYHLILSTQSLPNRLAIASASGHQIVVVFESARWMEAILAVVSNAAARFLSWAEAAELNRVIRMFFGSEIRV